MSPHSAQLTSSASIGAPHFVQWRGGRGRSGICLLTTIPPFPASAVNSKKNCKQLNGHRLGDSSERRCGCAKRMRPTVQVRRPVIGGSLPPQVILAIYTQIAIKVWVNNQACDNRHNQGCQEPRAVVTEMQIPSKYAKLVKLVKCCIVQVNHCVCAFSRQQSLLAIGRLFCVVKAWVIVRNWCSRQPDRRSTICVDGVKNGFQVLPIFRRCSRIVRVATHVMNPGVEDYRIPGWLLQQKLVYSPERRAWIVAQASACALVVFLDPIKRVDEFNVWEKFLGKRLPPKTDAVAYNEYLGVRTGARAQEEREAYVFDHRIVPLSQNSIIDKTRENCKHAVPKVAAGPGHLTSRATRPATGLHVQARRHRWR